MPAKPLILIALAAVALVASSSTLVGAKTVCGLGRPGPHRVAAALCGYKTGATQLYQGPGTGDVGSVGQPATRLMNPVEP